MTQLITDAGFTADDWTHGFCAQGAANDCRALDLPSDADPMQVALSDTLEMIRIDFPSSADGRSFADRSASSISPRRACVSAASAPRAARPSSTTRARRACHELGLRCRSTSSASSTTRSSAEFSSWLAVGFNTYSPLM